MRWLIAAVALATALWIPAAAEPKQDEVPTELKKWQGLGRSSQEAAGEVRRAAESGAAELGRWAAVRGLCDSRR